MKIEKIHHVAYHCNDARKTVLWYEQMLGMHLKWAMFDDWSRTKRAPKRAAFAHARELSAH